MPTTNDASRPCTCGSLLGLHDFRSSCAYGEWFVFGRCQWCQDLAVLTGCRDDAAPSSPWPIRRGAIVAHGPEGLEDTVFLPFLFGTTGLVEWDPRYALRVGSADESVDPSSALAAMNPVLEGHWCRVSDVPSLEHPACARLLAYYDVLIGEDMDRLSELVSACSALQGARPILHSLDLTDPDTDAPLSSGEFVVRAELDPSYDPQIESPPDPLRRCAWLGAVLLLRASDDSLSLLEQMIFASFVGFNSVESVLSVPADQRLH